MIVLAVVAAKGGVGKSTIVANLGVALSRHGREVLAIDLDPQNGLHLHLGGNVGDIAGLSRASMEGSSWSGVRVRAASGVDVVPFGRLDETDLPALERQIADDPHWLGHQLQRLQLRDDTVVILDTPPGMSNYLRQALREADLVISVMLADPASYATLPQIENMMRRHHGPRPGSLGCVCIINQVDDTQPVSRESVDLIQRALGERVIGLVHADRLVSEALAHRQTVVEASTHTIGRDDLVNCADRVLARLQTNSAAVRAEQPAPPALDSAPISGVTGQSAAHAQTEPAALDPAQPVFNVTLGENDMRRDGQASSLRPADAYRWIAGLLFVLLVLVVLLAVLRVGTR